VGGASFAIGALLITEVNVSSRKAASFFALGVFLALAFSFLGAQPRTLPALNANNNFKGKNTFSSLNGVLVLDGTTYAQTDVGFGSIVVAANSSGNVMIQIPASVTLTSYRDITANNVAIVCLNGATITLNGTAGGLEFDGTNDSVSNCTFTGTATGVNGSPIFATNSQFSFLNNTLTGFASLTRGSYVLKIVGGDGDLVQGNFFNNNAQYDIVVNVTTYSSGSVSNARILGNYAGEIIAHTAVSGTNLQGVIVAGNDLHNGQNSKTEFCEEIGQFGGNVPSNVTSTGNTCNLVASGTNGGFSFALCNQCAEAGDVFNANGYTFTIAAYEHALLSSSTVSGSIANDGMGGNGFVCDRCNNTTFTGNTVNGFSTASNGRGILIGVSSTTSPSARNNVVAGNVIIFPAGGAGHGIWEQCNATGATCQNNVFTGNVIQSDGTAGSKCIALENDVGTMSNENITGNSFLSCATGLLTKGIITNAAYWEGNNTSATRINDSSGALIPSVIRKGLSTTNLLISTAAPTISSGFSGTSPSIPANNGTAAFTLNVGSGTMTSAGAIGLPAANNGWICWMQDFTTPTTTNVVKETATSSTSATMSNYSSEGALTNYTANDVYLVSCFAR